jgi:hypothetical protein
MNERIRELAKQCYETGPLGKDGWPEYSSFNEGKFAQLIIQECMACSTWVGKMNTNSVEPVHTAHAVNQRIKQHFGVEYVA